MAAALQLHQFKVLPSNWPLQTAQKRKRSAVVSCFSCSHTLHICTAGRVFGWAERTSSFSPVQHKENLLKCSQAPNANTPDLQISLATICTWPTRILVLYGREYIMRKNQGRPAAVNLLLADTLGRASPFAGVHPRQQTEHAQGLV